MAIEKADIIGNITNGPTNHGHVLRLRAVKVGNIATRIVC